MSLPSKGTTKISIGNDGYLYKESADQLVLVSDSSGKTQKLICVIPHFGNLFFLKSKENPKKIIEVYSYGRSYRIPKPFVREVIFSAIELGWRPKNAGNSFYISIRELEETDVFEFYCGKNKDIGITAIEKLCYWPSENESLNRAIGIGLGFGESWSVPIDARIKQCFPFISKYQVDHLNSLISDLRGFAVEEINKCIKDLDKDAAFRQIYSKKEGVKMLINYRYSRISKENIDCIYSQCVDYIMDKQFSC